MNTLIKSKMDEVYADLQKKLVKYQALQALGWGSIVKTFIEYKLEEIRKLSDTYERLAALHERHVK